MKNKNRFCATLLIFFLILPIFSNFIGNETRSPLTELNYPVKAKADSPLYIDGNYWLGQNATSGYGNSTHPYIIENLVINASGLTVNGIDIINTDSYFILRNCTVTNSDSGFYGIYIENVTNGVIYNNTIANNGFSGMRLWESSFNIISNNTFRDNDNHGLQLRYFCLNNSITNNRFFQNTMQGFVLYGYCDNNNITDNYMIGNLGDGVRIRELSIGNDFINNTIMENGGAGIYSYESSGINTFIDNRIFKNAGSGLYLEGSDDNTIAWNFIVGQYPPIEQIASTGNIILNNTYTIKVENNGEFEPYSTEGNGTLGNPYIIEKFYIDATGLNESGIKFSGTDAYFILRNCTVINQPAGMGAIHLHNVRNGYIYNNTADANGESGIHLTGNCRWNTFEKNLVSDNGGSGIYVVNSRYNTFLNNTAIGNTYQGIALYNMSEHNQLTNNTAKSNLANGILLWLDCQNNTLTNNWLMENVKSGIFLEVNCDLNFVLNNTARRNTMSGILLYDNCHNNTLNYNDASENRESGIRLQDSCGSNIINFNTIEGNVLQGIRLWYCGFNTINNNTIRNNAGKGIDINLVSNANEIFFNTVEQNTTAIFLEGNLNNVVFGNDISGSWQGIEQILCLGNVISNNQWIASPENTTYEHEMFGYYYSTYGFENVRNGEDHPDWNDVAGTSEVIESWQGHHKVYQCPTGLMQIAQQFGQDISFGTMEFYMNAEDASKPFQFNLFGDDILVFGIRINNYKFQVFNGVDYDDTGKAAADNTWYHIRIDFDTTPWWMFVYPELNQWQWRLIIDGEYWGTYDFLQQYKPDKLNFYSLIHTNARSWDAVSYNWDPHYSIGDNEKKALFLDYAGSAFDWAVYSMDGGANRSISGDTVILLPPTGTHTIQIFGNDTTGYMYQTESREFTVLTDYALNVLTHTENNLIVAYDNVLLGAGVVDINPDQDLNISITYNTTNNWYGSWTNASFYYQINNDGWIGPYWLGFDYGIQNKNVTIAEGNYSKGDDLYYYFEFQQYTNTSILLATHYWTQAGEIIDDEAEARTNAFHKEVNSILLDLDLNYSVFYRAQKYKQIEFENGTKMDKYPWVWITHENLTLSFYNLSTTLLEYDAVCNEQPRLNHSVYEDLRNISKTSDPEFNLTDGIRSPFVISIKETYINHTTKLTFPRIGYNSVYPGRNLTFTGETINLTYRGIESFPYPYRSVLKFSSDDEYVVIRFDTYTGIMVYYRYKDPTENAQQDLVIALIGNNKSNAVNLRVEQRQEIFAEGDYLIPGYLMGILHDPPGDNSYTQIQTGHTIRKGYTISNTTTDSHDIHGGIEVFGASLSGGYTSTESESYIHDTEIEFTSTKSFTSSLESEDPSLIGPGRGDVYIGFGLLIKYYWKSWNYYIIYDYSAPNSTGDDIKVFSRNPRISFGLFSSATITLFNVPGAHLLPGMQYLTNQNLFADNNIDSTEVDDVTLIEGARFWTGDTILEYSFTHSQSTTDIYEFTSEIEWSVAVGFEIELYFGLITLDGGYSYTHTFEDTTINTTATESNREIICHLEDDDGTPVGEHDQFLTYVYFDHRYNSFGVTFDPLFTYTSRPFEIGTRDHRSPVQSEIFNLGEYLHGTVIINCGAIDEETGVGSVEFYIDNASFFSPLSTEIPGIATPTTSNPNVYQFAWDTSLLHGTYYLFAVVYDSASPVNNTRISAGYLVYIDNIVPSVCKARAYGPYRDAIRLYANAFDADSGVEYVEYWIGVPDGPGSTLIGIGLDSSDAFACTWPTDPGGADNGRHLIYARAFDHAGNSLTSVALEINVDSNAPFPGDTTPIWISIVIGSVAVAGAIMAHAILRNRHVPREPPMKKGIFMDKPPKGA